MPASSACAATRRPSRACDRPHLLPDGASPSRGAADIVRRRDPSRGRSGNALLLAVMVIATVVVIVSASAASASSSLVQTVRRGVEQELVAAATAVLDRYEARVVATGNEDPGVLVRDPRPNFGLDAVGGALVRWKIEPVRTQTRGDMGSATVAFIQNPRPENIDSSQVGNVDPPEMPNDANWLYRIAAEARPASSGGDESGDPKAVGVRYVSISKSPLFRYVIFYAQVGPKGDLELSHSGTLSIAGNVHSNGAIYLGGGLRVNDKVARLGPFDGALNPGRTEIGIPAPSGVSKVRVVGVDGVFRMSKPLAFAAINSFPLSNSVPSPGGAALDASPWDWSPAAYQTGGIFPNEDAAQPVGMTVAAATANGRIFNPYRFHDTAGAITIRGASGPQMAPGSAPDNGVTINGVRLTGIDRNPGSGGHGNDSRDIDRPADEAWRTTSVQSGPGKLGGYVRTFETGGRVTRLPTLMEVRCAEPQALMQRDADGDPTTDDHAAALPIFVGGDPLNLPPTGPIGPQEQPGAFLSLAMGNPDARDPIYRMERKQRGWTIRTSTGGATAAEIDAGGLIIRERPIPETAIWPGNATSAPIIDPTSPRYLPYAYGKHWYPDYFPFAKMDISQWLGVGSTWQGRSYPSSPVHAWRTILRDAANRRVLYDQDSGRIEITAAAGRQNVPYSYYLNDWSFVHLAQGRPSTVAGLNFQVSEGRLSAFDNLSEPFCAGEGSATDARLRQGETRSGPNGLTASDMDLLVGMTPGTDAHRFGMLTGFLLPTVSGNYAFNFVQGQRLFIDDALVFSTVSGENPAASVPLVAGRGYRLTAMFGPYGSSTSKTALRASLAVQWRDVSMTPAAWQNIPPALFRTPGSAAGVPTNRLRAVELRISAFDASATNILEKAGLMIRPGGPMAPPLQNGSERYAFIGYHPARGVFSERRLARSRQVRITYPSYFVGKGKHGNGTPSSAGVLGEDSLSVAGVQRQAKLNWHGSETVSTASTVTNTLERQTPTYINPLPSSFAGPLSIEVGGGVSWTLNGPFHYGPISIRRGFIPTTARTNSRSVHRDAKMTSRDPGADFLASDAACRFTLFNSTTGTGNFHNIFPMSNRWSVISDDTLRFSATTAAETETTSTQLYGEITFGNDATIWSTDDYPLPSISKNNGPYTTPTLADLLAFAPTGGFSVIRNQSFVNANINAIVEPTVPSYPPAPSPGAMPAVVTPPALSDTTFQIRRSVLSDASFNLNAWIPAGGTWFSPAGVQFGAWSYPAASAASTGGYQPDQWLNAALPTASSAPADAFGSAAPFAGDTGPLPNGKIWLRMERTNGTSYRLLYAVGENRPSPSGWTPLPGPGGTSTWTIDLDGFGERLFVGPAVQTGNGVSFAVDAARTASFDNWRLEVDDPDPAYQPLGYRVVDRDHPELADPAAVPPSIDRYLASQYQVFFCNREITEDFFNRQRDASARRLAGEEWFYQTREFWSQSPRWSHKPSIAKDADNFADVTNRRLLAKTTVLTLDLAEIQAYLRETTLTQAMHRPFTTPATARPAAGPGERRLNERFNGLLYAARTNRYPWNPAMRVANALIPPDEHPSSAINPWSSDPSIPLPNSRPFIAPQAADPLLENADSLATMALPAFAGVHVLQPYPLAEAPPFKPTEFHHGIRIVRGDSIDWSHPPRSPAAYDPATRIQGYPVGSEPEFGASKMSIVTPNLLYIQGDLNAIRHMTKMGDGSIEPHATPLMIMGDAVHILSTRWQDSSMQRDGIAIANVTGPASVTGGGSLVGGVTLPIAGSTICTAAIVTHNQPTTRQRVMEGQAAPLVDTVMFLENWNGNASVPITFTYSGSLVVLDSRRYTDAYLLDVSKTYGNSPFGIIQNANWCQPAANAPFPAGVWNGQCPILFNEPRRDYSFNTDLLTQDGTPPFAPFGITASGVGGWMRIVQ